MVIAHISVWTITELPTDKIDHEILFFSMEDAYNAYIIYHIKKRRGKTKLYDVETKMCHRIDG